MNSKYFHILRTLVVFIGRYIPNEALSMNHSAADHLSGNVRSLLPPRSKHASHRFFHIGGRCIPKLFLLGPQKSLPEQDSTSTYPCIPPQAFRFHPRLDNTGQPFSFPLPLPFLWCPFRTGTLVVVSGTQTKPRAITRVWLACCLIPGNPMLMTQDSIVAHIVFTRRVLNTTIHTRSAFHGYPPIGQTSRS